MDKVIETDEDEVLFGSALGHKKLLDNLCDA